MIEWGNFLLVLVASVVSGCLVILLFSLGLRFAGPSTDSRARALGIACFIVCGVVILFGLSLVIPYFTPFWNSVFTSLFG